MKSRFEVGDRVCGCDPALDSTALGVVMSVGGSIEDQIEVLWHCNTPSCGICPVVQWHPQSALRAVE